MRKYSVILAAFVIFCGCESNKKTADKIDRTALLQRNNPQITEFDSLSSLTVGNGEFAVTVDVTGLQTFPEQYADGVPLGTQSQWGWHSFDNPSGLRHEESWEAYDFGRGKKELYAIQFNTSGRQYDAAEWYRINPHRLHLGIIGLELDTHISYEAFSDIRQTLELEQGVIHSRYKINDIPVEIHTCVHPHLDMLAAKIESSLRPAIKLRFPYPTGGHSDDACDWNSNDRHQTEIITQTASSALLKRTLGNSIYFVSVQWEGNATIAEKEANYFVIIPADETFSITCLFTPAQIESRNPSVAQTVTEVKNYWHNFWHQGAAVDFSGCTDPRARELERRVVLSQYLLAVQCAGSTPPQETGLTYNSWYGKFHLEMIWWHQAQFALWNRPELLSRTMDWYEKAEPIARSIAERQGFKGVRWMKMTDPDGIEAPSRIGSFLIWQQPHYIFMAELLYRADPGNGQLKKYSRLIHETAEFMYDFATYQPDEGRFVLNGIIPAQETLRASETVNPPFELSYWHFGMGLAQQWRERNGEKRHPAWDDMIDKLSPLAYNDDKLYLAAETAPDTYTDIRFTSDHMAVLGAFGILPQCRLFREDYMKNTLFWIWDNWNWDQTWGWDYPMTAMNAARLGEPEKAVGALLMEKRTNTYLPNGHNYQNERLRVYLPGNGGLLYAIALMCAGWDGNTKKNPGFPNDGTWDVRWEGLKPAP